LLDDIRYRSKTRRCHSIQDASRFTSTGSRSTSTAARFTPPPPRPGWPTPLGLDLHFLLSAWAGNARDEHTIVAWAIRQLHMFPILHALDPPDRLSVSYIARLVRLDPDAQRHARPCGDDALRLRRRGAGMTFAFRERVDRRVLGALRCWTRPR
jgi:hypothetical protein